MLKIIDRLLLKSFVGPFVVTFSIAIFFFLMQTLWFYIDDIVGKGLGFFFIIELLAYKCVSLIPMALPLAILISSVMVMGSLAEHYELSTMKSAGTRLLRIMRPLIFVGFASALLSYYCSATLIPLANLKFGSRMYDVQQQKPALRLDEGIFNDDFQGFSIHIGKKGTDGKTIKDVLIYDQSESAKGGYSQITAKEGQMFMAEEGRYFIMNLKDGNQYIEVTPGGVTNNNGKYPFVRTSFKQWTKVFDMNEFSLNRTNEELFTNNKSMMSIPQLAKAVDSMDLRLEDRRKSLSDQVRGYFTFLPEDSLVLQYEATDVKTNADTAQKALWLHVNDSTQNNNVAKDTSTSAPNTPAAVPVPKTIYRRLKLNVDPQTGQPLNDKQLAEVHKELDRREAEDSSNQSIATTASTFEGPLAPDTIQNFIEIFPAEKRLGYYDRAKTFALSMQNQAESTVRSLDAMKETQVKYAYEMWTKYSIAVVCIIFVFIGAPMGAIVRKGGFGYPILISIIFFMLFVILTIFCRKIAEAFVLPPAGAAWLPAIVLFPIGLILTLKAMNDSSLNLVEGITFIRERFKKRKVSV